MISTAPPPVAGKKVGNYVQCDGVVAALLVLGGVRLEGVTGTRLGSGTGWKPTISRTCSYDFL